MFLDRVQVMKPSGYVWHIYCVRKFIVFWKIYMLCIYNVRESSPHHSEIGRPFLSKGEEI